MYYCNWHKKTRSETCIWGFIWTRSRISSYLW